MRMPFLVAAVDRALRGPRRSRARRDARRGPLGRRRLGGAHGRSRGAAAPPRLPAGRRAPRPRTAAGLGRRRGLLPRALRERSACPLRAGSAPRARARRAREGRARAGRAPRALLVPAAREGRRGRRLRSRSRTRGTIRPRRCCCACCAAPARAASPACGLRSGDLLRPLLGVLARRGARAPARARARLARGSLERRPRAPAQPRAPRAAAVPRAALQPARPGGARPDRGAPRRRGRLRRGAGVELVASIGTRDGAVLVLDRLAAGRRAPGRGAGRRSGWPLQRTGGLAGVDRGHVDRVLGLARAEAPAGRRLPLPGGREARFTHRQLRLEKRAIAGHESRIIVPDRPMRNKISVLYTEERIARRVAELGEEITQGLRGAGDLRPRPDEGQPRLHGRPDPQDPARPDRPPGPRHLPPRAGRGQRPDRDRLLDRGPARGAGRAAGRRHRGHRDHAQLPARPHPRARAEEPAVCALIDKPEARKIDVHPDWTAFPVHEPLADQFMVGYGLDWMERFRGLPYIGTIPRPAALGPAAGVS